MDKEITFGDILELLKSETADGHTPIRIRLEDDTLTGPISSSLWAVMKHMPVTGIDISMGGMEVHVCDTE